MLPTPSTSHVNYDRVYEPAEDSYLLLDTLSSTTEAAFLQARFPANSSSPLVLEVGTGSGVVLAFITAHADHIIGRSDVATIGVDMNHFACMATKKTVRLAIKEASLTRSKPGMFADCFLGDLTTAMRPTSVDCLIFNPPYVPSERLPSVPADDLEETAKDEFMRDSQLLFLSTDGGEDGMETTNRLLSELEFILSNRGVAYILLCAQNKPGEVIAQIRDWPGRWSAEKVGSSGKKAGWERLCVIRISRSRGQS